MSMSFDRVADIYDDTRRTPAEVIGQVMDIIAREVDASAGPVLEVGIGTGRMAIPLAERGFRVAGVDLSEKMLMHLRAKSSSLLKPPCVARGDATRLPFHDNVFSAVLAVHVFHLVDDLRGCLSEARRVIRPGGYLLFGDSPGGMRNLQEALRAEYGHGLDDDIVSMMQAQGIKVSDHGEVHQRIAQSIQDMGAEIVQLRPIEWDSETTCGEIVGRIKGRVISSLWNVPEDSLERFVEMLKSQLAGKVGPPETVVRFRRSFRLTRVRFPQ